MDIHTHLEDLSNEIFFEIFDYLHALDIFTGFTSLNKRISSILQSIPLRVVILYEHCRRQINFLSSHLTLHAHQVISLEIYDTIRDDTSIINLLFNRHNFINLESCTFVLINSSTKLKNVIKKIKSLNKLVSFRIYQPNDESLNEKDKHDLTRTMLMHKSSSLRSILLHYPYDCLDISNYTSITSNLISLELIISGSSLNVSVYSIISILRLCHTIRHLGILIKHTDLQNNNNMNISHQVPSMKDNNLPILSQIISFNLAILTKCDSHSISYILHCMPNLRHFYFLLFIQKAAWPFPGELLDGYVWTQILGRNVPYLSKFEFHISIAKRYPKLDLDIVVNSFDYFVGKYSNWHMIIDRWKYHCQHTGEYIMLRTLNYHKHEAVINTIIPFIYSESLETRSTMITNNHYLFYQDITKFRICIAKRRPTITWSSPLYQQINYLILGMPRKISVWNSLLNIVNFDEINDNDAQQTITDLSHFVHLPNVTHVEFGRTFIISDWKHIQFILQACPNVTNLTISTPLLVLSKLIDNPSLISIFKQIKMIESRTKNMYFPSNFALKLVQRFPSLSHVELQVFSFDNCVSVIYILIDHLKTLSYIKISYSQDTLLDDPFSRDHIIEKRHERFPDDDLNEEMMNVTNNGEDIEIWLR